MTQVVVTGSFDDVRSRHTRFLEEASKLGELHVMLWSDETVAAATGKYPKFPEQERRYVLESVRFVSRVTLVSVPIDRDTVPIVNGWRPDLWVVGDNTDNPSRRLYAASRGIQYHVIKTSDLAGFPVPPVPHRAPSHGRKKAIVTGCYDWFHSGHVRFFEEASELGDLYVAVGNDANVRYLKGQSHPMFPQDERRYMVQSIRYVKQALITSGKGWMDAEPEIAWLKPDLYVVNEDGDKPEKRAFSAQYGIQYVVLKRAPKVGLPRRQSTDLRGF